MREKRISTGQSTGLKIELFSTNIYEKKWKKDFNNKW